jgi:hypothetical protein
MGVIPYRELTIPITRAKFLCAGLHAGQAFHLVDLRLVHATRAAHRRSRGVDRHPSPEGSLMPR